MSKNQKDGIVIGSQTGGVNITADINTGGATIIVSSSGNVHYGSGTQINISTSETKKQK